MPESPRPSRRIPPLVWIIVAILVGWGVVALIQNNGTTRTPNESYPANAGAPEADPVPATVPPAAEPNTGVIGNPAGNPAEVDETTPNESSVSRPTGGTPSNPDGGAPPQP